MAAQQSYRKIVARSFGGPEVLQVEEVVGLPEPGAGEVRIRVEAAGVGYTDTIIRRGRYVAYKAGLPLTPGYDLVGVVDAVGPGVTEPAVGVRVADMPVYGSYSQYTVRPAADVVPVPDGVEPAVAVDVPLMWNTAWQMLTRCVSLSPGDTVLVVGAAGSAGRSLVVLARHLGLRVIGTCTAEDMPKVEALGAHPVDFRHPDLVGAIAEAVGGAGVAAAFDPVGGKSWDTSWRSLAPGGTLVGFGVSDFLESGRGNWVALIAMLRITKLWTLTGKIDRTRRRSLMYNIHTRRGQLPQEWRQDCAELLGLLATGEVAPPPPEVIPLASAADAHRRIAQGGLPGRLVIDPWA